MTSWVAWIQQTKNYSRQNFNRQPWNEFGIQHKEKGEPEFRGSFIKWNSMNFFQMLYKFPIWNWTEKQLTTPKYFFPVQNTFILTEFVGQIYTTSLILDLVFSQNLLLVVLM